MGAGGACHTLPRRPSTPPPACPPRVAPGAPCWKVRPPCSDNPRLAPRLQNTPAHRARSHEAQSGVSGVRGWRAHQWLLDDEHEHPREPCCCINALSASGAASSAAACRAPSSSAEPPCAPQAVVVGTPLLTKACCDTDERCGGSRAREGRSDEHQQGARALRVPPPHL